MNAAQPRLERRFALDPFPIFEGCRLSEDLFAKAWQATREYERWIRQRPKPPVLKVQDGPVARGDRKWGYSDKLEPVEDMVREAPGITATEIAAEIDASKERVRERLALLVEEGRLTRYRDRSNAPYRYEVTK